MSADTFTQDTHPTQVLSDTRVSASGGGNDSRQASVTPDANVRAPAGEDSRSATWTTTPRVVSPSGHQLAGRREERGTQAKLAASDQPADRHRGVDAQRLNAVGQPGPAAIPGTTTTSLLDPALAFAADVLDDIERVRIANENRLRQLTRSVEDADGEVRGFGLDESHPDVARLAAIVGTLVEVEKDATKHLEKVMRRQLLHAWAKSMRGVGDKQVARLLAVIGDPYWRPEMVTRDGTMIPAGPRTVSALWAYCGLHNVPVGGHTTDDSHTARAADGAHFPAGHPTAITHGISAGRDQLAARHPSHNPRDDQTAVAWVAARRQRGQRANWSTKAKMRAHLIAEKCMVVGLVKPCKAFEHGDQCQCSPYRLMYEARRLVTAERRHAVPCPPCGPPGKPAAAGTPWSDKHKLQDALRIVAKKGILLDLWREAKRLHEAGGA